MEKTKKLSRQEVRNRTIAAFSIFGLAVISSVVLFSKLLGPDVPVKNGTPAMIRDAFESNEKVFSGMVKSNRLAKTYPVTAAVKKVRVNGGYGLKDSLAMDEWQLNVVKLNGDTLHIRMEQLLALKKTDIVFDFKCIEGWSQVTHWAGVKFSEFIDAFGLEKEAQAAYIGLKTPDGEYYVGIDMASAVHPQTILCYEMNGEALPQNQGFPLRLIIPVKYGIKHLKRIGTLSFSDTPPADYWAERGYDYFSGL